MALSLKDTHADFGGVTIAQGGTLAFGEDVSLLHSTDALTVTCPTWKAQYDSAAYYTITQADGGGVTLDSVSDGTAGFTFSQAVTCTGALTANSTLKQQGESVVVNQRHRVTAAEINAGHTLLAAVTGLKYRIIDITLIAIGGNGADVTSVDVKGTQGTAAVTLFSVAVAALTQSAVIKPNSANVTVLADGASFVQNDAASAITIIKNGADMTGATNIDVLLTYALEA